ncbi:sulfatase [Candidatus Fermentibacteria bacterium]|nr:sulfatase [Candidatus Fermentibacteria bacterium]
MTARPNIILIILDACRRDALEPYAPAPTRIKSGAHTPVLMGLAEEGVVIADCQSTSSCTAISVASILTGRGPHQHGITTLVGGSLLQGVPTVGAHLQGAGYTTAFFPSTAVLNRTTQLNRGFHHFDDGFLEPLYRDLSLGRILDLPLFRRHFYKPPKDRVVAGSLRFCEVTTDAALRWMSKTPDPLMAVIHYLEPHYPYWPPEGWRVSEDPLDQANYHASLRYLDAVCLERILHVVRARGSDTLLLITSDHGEYWGTHGFRPTGDHGDLYQEVLAVPLIVWGTGASMLRQSWDAPWSHVDLVPTILRLSGVQSPRGGEGADCPMVTQIVSENRPRHSWEDAAFNDPAYVEAMGGFRRGGVAVRTGSHKLIERAPGLGGPELYDLASDPEERRNLVDFSSGLRQALLPSLPPPIVYETTPQPDLTRRLAALGYF